MDQQKHALYSLQPIISHNKYLFDNSGNIHYDSGNTTYTTKH